MKLQDLLKITQAIKSMNDKELNLIVDAVNSARKRQSVFSSTKFSVGQKVSFGRPRGRQYIGFIEKMNPAKAVIKTDTQTWRVPYSLMKEVA
jgi:hypothetical protein